MPVKMRYREIVCSDALTLESRKDQGPMEAREESLELHESLASSKGNGMKKVTPSQDWSP